MVVIRLKPKVGQAAPLAAAPEPAVPVAADAQAAAPPAVAPSSTMTIEQFKNECARRRAAGLVLVGNTFPVREHIKAAGGIWDARNRAWLMPTMDSLEAMRGMLPPSEPRAGNGGQRGGRRRSWRRGHWVSQV